ncbi:phosphatidylserine decarboxylase [Priestia endophytica]|uniref:phosphatidylserine decarboxylase n=1 Tax=Priestia endophytica TaxID=135735 RepID=UPI002E1B9F67|nr:phosphatidylserine decarboxylase [Priestia endophytica]MED4070647.1 phosphatidylserine decarboxylase [Priestia endophytica]
MKKILYQSFIELTNRPFTSKLIERFSCSPFSRKFIRSYANLYNVKQEEMSKELSEYGTLHELFTRKLKDQARPFSLQTEVIISPVDGEIEQYGTLTNKTEMIVKEKPYSVKELVGNDYELQKYIGGTYFILYLSPSDYHRIHSPADADIIKTWTLGNKSYPVNQLGLKYGKAPLVKNYRKLTELAYNEHRFLLVKVGAMFVNSITMTHDEKSINKGDEIAYFSFGSTVILLFEKDSFVTDESIQKGQKVKVGQTLGRFQS